MMTETESGDEGNTSHLLAPQRVIHRLYLTRRDLHVNLALRSGNLRYRGSALLPSAATSLRHS